MADVQNHFKNFHDAIKLGYDDNFLLREKRDTVLNDLKRGLKRIFSRQAPKFTYFNQGSYALGTGVVPLDSDYDIDIGLVFQLDRNDFSPTRVKGWVYDALNTRNRTVYFLRPCIRVQYHKSEYEAFHIDLAVYTKEETSLSNKRKYYISKGLPGSKNEYKQWEPAEPFELLKLLKKRFSDAEDAKQFRRVIRYLKRWTDLNFYSDGHGKPRGIAITALAYKFFHPQRFYSWRAGRYCYSDLKATRNFVASIINQFNWFTQKISITLPVEPHNNLFAKMTENQMSDFRERLLLLKESLDSAVRSRNIENACLALCEEFGDDFPTPEYE